MNAGSQSNASSSAAQTPGYAAPSKNAPPNPASEDSAHLSEAEYVRARAHEAQHAMARTLSIIGANLRHGVDPRSWTREHPWAGLATAAVGGFVGALVVVPSKHAQALRQLERLHKALAKDDHTDRKNGEVDDPKSSKKSSGHGIVQTVVREVVGLVRPLVFSTIAGLINARSVQPPPQDDGGGAPTSGSPDPMAGM